MCTKPFKLVRAQGTDSKDTVLTYPAKSLPPSPSGSNQLEVCLSNPHILLFFEFPDTWPVINIFPSPTRCNKAVQEVVESNSQTGT
ncbi:hypothetical protein CH63R_05953 [Colletotrichum higginsianum IMI 349063]|uniref:Uncharacterized protein n=1 Tax=Colletotrichum higginsianum (strain IMI 349063) TaxID=759273 RepID=A0A1B7YDP6_COLHI|nr:hypothetical protein CH63R_05953 [Colletotrichum higginsianum IMI 349063]OBR10261.1 hypothetical protein CH63R_05953 [Colletotrichum higginsianum IMI 349063]